MEKKKPLNVYFEDANVDVRIVTDLEKADLIITAHGTLVENKKEVEKVIHNTNSSPLTLEMEISHTIINLGVPINIRGYRYIIEAIQFIMYDSSVMGSVTKKLYPKLALRFNTLPSRVERAIRHAIEVAWAKGDFELQNKLFKFPASNRTKPTNSEFLSNG